MVRLTGLIGGLTAATRRISPRARWHGRRPCPCAECLNRNTMWRWDDRLSDGRCARLLACIRITASRAIPSGVQ